MSKLIIVSNRLPITLVRKKGKLKIQSSSGGLVTALSSLENQEKSIWTGWPGIALSHLNPEADGIKKLLKSNSYHPVFLSKKDIEDYYQGFCNEMIWPLFHYFVQYALYDKKFWKAYKRVNERFCNEIMDVADSRDTFWIHDYHLMLLPKLLKERLPNAKIGFFLHIPFPSSEIFRLIPWSEEIIEGLLGSDLIGFHTFDYVRHFLESVRRVLGYEHTLGQITVKNRAVKVETFPMGIDYEKYSGVLNHKEIRERVQKFRKKIGTNYKVVLSVDRLDYTKGIPQRLNAFDVFLKRNPKYKGRIVFILVAVPSRTEVEHYVMLKERVDKLIGRINGEHGTIGWVPIWYLYRSFEFSDLAALYSIADVLFITPIRDGMNLVAKEFVAAKTNNKGVLILGEMAGTAKELGEAIVVNPNDEEKTADAIRQALEMPEKEQYLRMETMQIRLKRYDLKKWASDFMDRLDHINEIQQKMNSKALSSKGRRNLIKFYTKSKNSLILLDYDGTLMPFNENPEKVKPDQELKSILRSLYQQKNNQIVFISGRNRKTLDDWVGSFSNGLVAEHGVWFKDGVWKTIEVLSDGWKKEIHPILEIFVDRTPGSFIEEKDYSLVWHFRKVDPAMAMVRVGELKDILLHITANLDVGVLEGNKVIEVKNSGVNKGRAALYWISKKKWDFIMSIGDDHTDEDIFEVLPGWAYSIKVGFGPSKARFNLRSYVEVRTLLKQMVGA